MARDKLVALKCWWVPARCPSDTARLTVERASPKRILRPDSGLSSSKAPPQDAATIGIDYCPVVLSILLASFTPLSPFTYFAMPR